MTTEDRNYCLVPDCDEAPYPGEELCPTHEERPMRRLTRQERLEGLADSGCDTWAEYREEN